MYLQACACTSLNVHCSLYVQTNCTYTRIRTFINFLHRWKLVIPNLVARHNLTQKQKLLRMLCAIFILTVYFVKICKYLNGENSYCWRLLQAADKLHQVSYVSCYKPLACLVFPILFHPIVVQKHSANRIQLSTAYVRMQIYVHSKLNVHPIGISVAVLNLSVCNSALHGDGGI